MSISNRMMACLSWACLVAGIGMVQGCGGSSTAGGAAPAAPAAVESPGPTQGPANNPATPTPAEEAEALQIG